MKEDVYEIILSNELEKIVETHDVLEDELTEAIEIGEKMIRTCVLNGGIGLAAPQVNINKKIIVYSYKEENDQMLYKIVFNPMYIPQEKKMTSVWEGCLSYLDKVFAIKRYKYIRAIYYSYLPEDKKLLKITKNLRGDEAIVFQHETDHLYNKHIGLVGIEVDMKEIEDTNAED